MTAKKQTKLTSNSYLAQTLGQQTRQLQLKCERLRLERRKVEALESIAANQCRQTSALDTIASELITVRSLYSAVNGIELLAPGACSDAEC